MMQAASPLNRMSIKNRGADTRSFVKFTRLIQKYSIKLTHSYSAVSFARQTRLAVVLSPF